MAYLNCPSCRLTVYSPVAALALEECPRCRARLGSISRLFRTQVPARLLADRSRWKNESRGSRPATEPAPDGSGLISGDQLAAVTNGIVALFRKHYGRGPTMAKSYALDDRFIVCVLSETMTTVERTLANNGSGDLVRRLRLSFQEAMADAFMTVVAEATGRSVLTYHSQLTLDPDMGFEFFLLGD